MYHIGQTGRSNQKGFDFDFVIYDLINSARMGKGICIEFTRGDSKGQKIYIRESEIDNTLLFNQ